METLVFDPVAKSAHVSTLLPNQNYGGATEIWACSYDFFGTKYICISYMEINISAIEAGSIISSDSKLEIYVTHRWTYRQMVWAWVTDDSWGEDTITYNNKPIVSAPYNNYLMPTADGWFTITGAGLAAWLQTILDDKGGSGGWSMYPICLATQEGGFRFYSDDAASYKPKFTVVYTPPSVGGAMRPTKYWGSP